MPYYVICPVCGASLDPGEKCDCTKKASETPHTLEPGQIDCRVDPAEVFALSY